MNPISDFLISRKIVPPGGPWRLLDTRPESSFQRAHLVGAVSLPVAGNDWTAATLEKFLPSILLPPRHDALLVIVGSRIQGESVVRFLGERGRTSVEFMIQSDDTERALPEWVWARGQSREHLWSAPPYLVDHLSLLPPPSAGPVLDLGCGSGRAMVWLAEKGYEVTGIDHQPEALLLGEKLAALRGVSCRFLPGDLRKPDCIPCLRWSIVLSFRFLQRGLLETMVTHLLKPGGVGVVRTFRDAPGYQGHPALIHRLARGELLRYFPAALCEVLAHEENHDPDGRPAAGIVARRLV